ncbi:MAG: pyrroloquinoline quinone precursor peptide PqqA [Pseudomonadota bacterium]|nr:pyrroloquinoline quinone precursor peptide PqqA [Pseudomonadota bacterium]
MRFGFEVTMYIATR